MRLIVCSNNHAPLTVRPIYSSSKLRTAQMVIFSVVAIIGLEKFCITFAYLQWLCHSGERAMAHGPLVLIMPPTWKKLEGHIASGEFIHLSILLSITLFDA